MSDILRASIQEFLNSDTFLSFKSKIGEVGNAVRVAIDAGYRHIDTAQNYYNEEEIGEALEEKIKEGKVKREDVFITTKVCVLIFLCVLFIMLP